VDTVGNVVHNAYLGDSGREMARECGLTIDSRNRTQ
jgi:hypothetical protein